MRSDLTRPHPDSPGSDAYSPDKKGQFNGMLNGPYMESHVDRAMAPRAVQEERDRLLRLVPDMYAEIKYNRERLSQMVREARISNV